MCAEALKNSPAAAVTQQVTDKTEQMKSLITGQHKASLTLKRISNSFILKLMGTLEWIKRKNQNPNNETTWMVHNLTGAGECG